ncbi:MINY4 hydrolase, partial [Nothoprocta ornata]|nr:MINY4 hydrolase [Nothoprocta ornata]
SFQGLKKTMATMDREFPHSALSINNRNELRDVLHLHSLYKQNKAKENPLKTLLEIITNYFLEHVRTSKTITSSSSLTNPQSKSSSAQLPNCSDEEHVHRSTGSKTEDPRCNVEDPFDKVLPARRHQHKSERCHTGSMHNSHSLSDADRKLKDSWEDLKATVSSEELKATVKEKQKSRSGLIIRGMMAGPTANAPEDLQKRRLSKRSISTSSTGQSKGEEYAKNDLSVPSTDFQESKGPSTQSTSSLSSHSDGALKGNSEFSSKPSSSSHTSAASEKLRHFPKDPEDSFARLLSERERTKMEERKSIPSFDVDSNEKSLKGNAPHRHSGPGRDKRERSLKKNEIWLSSHRKFPASSCNKEETMKDVLELVDVEDEATTAEVSKIPDLSALYMFHVASKAIDISLAKVRLTVMSRQHQTMFIYLFIFFFHEFYYFPQGGPCGVLAAVQACVLQQLIFGDGNKNKDTRSLQPSEVHRTKCLTMAIADILWRAGGNEKAIVALPSGKQQFTPIGKYKADGILETLILHSATRYEDLIAFLQKNIHQFEIGPCGCILLTVSVILSRTINLVRNDFDVLTNRLIGSHGYCTQELVNLLLTGKAVSNVFNNVIELDSGNGNITILKGITSRSDIGLLSLFEHYDVCQVGCYLKTPKYPIWLVCSESHFSVLFCLEKNLLGDWKKEQRFDLYYYDGLANQEEEIRLTV